MDTIEGKVQKLQELSRKQKKINEFKQDIASILGSADMNEKKQIAEKMSTIKYESMDQARNLQFIVPHVVKELYDHDGPKGEFIIPKKEPVVVEPIPIIEPVVEPTAVIENNPEPTKTKPIINPEHKEKSILTKKQEQIKNRREKRKLKKDNKSKSKPDPVSKPEPVEIEDSEGNKPQKKKNLLERRKEKKQANEKSKAEREKVQEEQKQLANRIKEKEQEIENEPDNDKKIDLELDLNELVTQNEKLKDNLGRQKKRRIRLNIAP